MLMTSSLVAELVPFGKKKEKVMPKYTVIQSLVTEERKRNIFSASKRCCLVPNMCTFKKKIGL